MMSTFAKNPNKRLMVQIEPEENKEQSGGKGQFGDYIPAMVIPGVLCLTWIVAFIVLLVKNG